MKTSKALASKVSAFSIPSNLAAECLTKKLPITEAGRFAFPFIPWPPLMIPVAKADKWLDNNHNAIPIRGLKSKRPQRNKKYLA